MSNEMELFRRRIEAEEDAVIDIQFILLDLMQERGMTKEQLAKAVGVSKSRISQLFGSGANPTVKTVARIFDALDQKWLIKHRSLAESSWERFESELKRTLPTDAWSRVLTVQDREANDNYAEDRVAA